METLYSYMMTCLYGLDPLPFPEGINSSKKGGLLFNRCQLGVIIEYVNLCNSIVEVKIHAKTRSDTFFINQLIFQCSRLHPEKNTRFPFTMLTIKNTNERFR